MLLYILAVSLIRLAYAAGLHRPPEELEAYASMKDNSHEAGLLLYSTFAVMLLPALYRACDLPGCPRHWMLDAARWHFYVHGFEVAGVTLIVGFLTGVFFGAWEIALMALPWSFAVLTIRMFHDVPGQAQQG